MVIIDTTVWIDYLHGTRNKETDYLDREVGRQRFGLTDLILCETLQGIADDRSFTRVLRGFLADAGSGKYGISGESRCRILNQPVKD